MGAEHPRHAGVLLDRPRRAGCGCRRRPAPAAIAIGRCLAMVSIRRSADASGSPVPSSSAAPRSASNSRERDTAIWISEAAIGARIATAEHHQRVGVATVAVAAAEHRRVHRHLGHERDRRGDRGRDRADQDVAVLDVHQLVRHHAFDLVGGQRLQQALGGAHDGVLRAAAGGEGVGLGGGRDGDVGIGRSARSARRRIMAWNSGACGLGDRAGPWPT